MKTHILQVDYMLGQLLWHISSMGVWHPLCLPARLLLPQGARAGLQRLLLFREGGGATRIAAPTLSLGEPEVGLITRSKSAGAQGRQGTGQRTVSANGAPGAVLGQQGDAVHSQRVV